MAEHRDLLIEIGAEELPPKALSTLSQAFEQGVLEGLSQVGLNPKGVHRYATPRRLALWIQDLPIVQPERRQERRGPALSAAYDSQGQPTRAALGFASSCGIENLDELQTLRTEKGAWLVHVSLKPGEPTKNLIPHIVETALGGLPIPKRMRWGNRDEEFVRPVHWAVLLFGDETIPATILGVSTGRETRGHRFHHPQPLHIAEPAAYAPLLQTEGKVIADYHERRKAIRAQAEAAAISVGGHAVIDPALLDEVTALVEWPVAIVGDFEQRFLNIPAEALITAMQNHQKYFPIVDATGRLTSHFITIANIESKHPSEVRAGNERVIRPRFSDAEFFWHQDLKQPLANLYPMLKGVIFQHRLGSLHDKSERIAALARAIAEASGGHPDWAERASRLAKCDLLTHMVQEFPELQGIMGRHYAHHDGESGDVAQALEDQYHPRFAGDALPQSDTGKALALAERLDTLVGIFAIGQAPSGAKDPFALRRAALGVLRILIEGKLHLDLATLLTWTAEQFPADIQAEKIIENVIEFVMERLRAYYLDQGIRTDTFEAVLACRPTCPLNFERRIRAVEAFRELPESVSLAAANKRIRNILKQAEGTYSFQIHMDRLIENEEQVLAGRLAELSSETIPLMETGLYGDALTRLAVLREPVDAFFDAVMVMTDDLPLRENRIALLSELGSLFLRIADFSRLQN